MSERFGRLGRLYPSIFIFFLLPLRADSRILTAACSLLLLELRPSTRYTGCWFTSFTAEYEGGCRCPELAKKSLMYS